MRGASKRSAILLFSLMLILATLACEGAPRQSGMSEVQEKELEDIRERFRHERNYELPMGSCWTVAHCADPKEVEKEMPTLDLLGLETEEALQFEGVTDANVLKRKMAGLMKSRDVVIRGFGAIIMGVIGDQAYATDVAELLREKPFWAKYRSDEFLVNSDRSCAAVALGVMGAKE